MKVTEKEVKTGLYIVIAIAIVVVGYIVVKKVLQATGFVKSAEEQAQEQAQGKAIEDFSKQAQKTSRQTKSTAQLTFVADTIYNALKRSAVSDDKTTAYEQLARVLTDADMAALIKVFGKRQEYAFGVPTGAPKTLPEMVRDNFKMTDIDDLNKLYARSKMVWRF